ncbi:MAG: leucine-rich repeat domain-containing protein [Candidatus Odinarchaeota archaeon]
MQEEQLEQLALIFNSINLIVMEDALADHVSFDSEGMVTGLDLCGLDLEVIPDGLASLERLEILDLSHNKITEIQKLENLADSLSLLDLSSNRIEIIEGLDNLRSLKVLELSNNPISEIQGLSRLVNLEVLNLSGCEIEKIQGLEHLRSLTTLNLSNNIITEITGLEAQKKLKHLDLGFTRITEIKGLIHPLKTLVLTSNMLSFEEIQQTMNLSEENFIEWVNEVSRKKLALENQETDDLAKLPGEQDDSSIDPKL